MATLHAERSGVDWDLDESHIFNQINSFAKRCYDMIEICEAMIIFGRMDETETISKPFFHTSKGIVFESMVEKCESFLADSLVDIKRVIGTVMLIS